MQENRVPVLWDDDCRSASIYQEMVRGMKLAALRSQNNVVIYTSVGQILKEEPQARVVIVVGYEAPKLQDSLEQLMHSGLQVVLAGLDGDRFGRSVSSTTPSRRQATAQLIRYLMQCGKRRIALVGCGDRSVNDMQRCEILKSVLHAQGSELAEKSVFYFREHVSESFEAFYPHRASFDAVICPNDYTALCFMRFCQKHSIRIPEDLYLTAFSNRLIGRYCAPTLTTMAIDFSKVGEYAYLAWNFLEQHIDENLQMQIITPSCLIVRQSTGNEIHPDTRENSILYDSDYQGEPFYSDRMIASVMQIENCLCSCVQLDLQIIHELLLGSSYETISERLFLSRSALNYRLKKLFLAASVKSRKEFETLFGQYFTEENQF